MVFLDVGTGSLEFVGWFPNAPNEVSRKQCGSLSEAAPPGSPSREAAVCEDGLAGDPMPFAYQKSDNRVDVFDFGQTSKC